MKRPTTLKGRIRPTGLGMLLRTYRMIVGRTLRDVAPQIGIGHATLMRIEAGQDMDVRTALKLAWWLLEPSDIKSADARPDVRVLREEKT